jgi:DNA polymerase-3 subunit delta
MPVAYTPQSHKTLFIPPKRAYIFFGEDDWEKRQALALLRQQTTDETFADFDVEELDAGAASVEAVAASVSQFPFGSPRRLVIVRNAEHYRRREAAAAAERLAAFIPQLGSVSTLVLLVSSDGERQAATALGAKLDKAVEAAGAVVKFGALGPEGMMRWAVHEAKLIGRTLEPRAAERLVEACHGDRRVLASELDKAVLLAGDAPVVTLEMVEQVVIDDPEDVMFQLVDAITAGNTARALSLLRETIDREGKAAAAAPRLLSLLGRQFRLLHQAASLDAMGHPASKLKQLPAEVLSELPAEGSILSVAWKSGELYRHARRWGHQRIGTAMRLLLECDLSNKGAEMGMPDPETNLQMLVVRLGRLLQLQPDTRRHRAV